MFRGLATVLLLVVSNAFMTLAWYGHIAFKSRLERFGLTAIVLLSWGIALFEYCFQVPANRIGSAEFGGPFSIWELKVIQGVVPLSVFTVFALVFMKSDTLRWNHLAGFRCLVLAVYFIFRKWRQLFGLPAADQGQSPADRLRRPLPPFYRKQAFDRRRIEAVFDDLGRNASDDGIGRHIARHNGP